VTDRIRRPLVHRPAPAEYPDGASPVERQTLDRIREEMSMTTPIVAPTAKTPILQDKRLWLSVGTILSLLISSVLKIEINPEIIAAIITTVVVYITGSATKEASVAKALVSKQD
jgi:hypothetical protein